MSSVQPSGYNRYIHVKDEINKKAWFWFMKAVKLNNTGLHCHEDGDMTFLRNSCKYSPLETASYTKIFE